MKIICKNAKLDNMVENNRDKTITLNFTPGLSLGGILAIVCSWVVNKSVLWCVLHFFCNWIYVAWYLIKYVWKVV
jgi:hypothetical protein